MKLLTFLLSIYLVALSCLPCADMEADSTTSKETASNHEDHSHNENDLCSPFCVCNCCGAQFASFTTTIYFDIPTITTAIETKESIYKPIFTSNYYGSIWQPPQIA